MEIEIEPPIVNVEVPPAPAVPDQSNVSRIEEENRGLRARLETLGRNSLPPGGAVAPVAVSVRCPPCLQEVTSSSSNVSD